MYDFLRAAGMDGGQSAAMPGIHCIQERPRFRSAHFAHDDAVWPMAEYGFEKVIERDLAAMRIRLGLCGDEVWLADMQLRSVLDNKDALVLRDGVGQDVQERCFSRPGSACNEDVSSVMYRLSQSDCLYISQHFRPYKIGQNEVPRGEPPNGHQWPGIHDRRNHGRHTASIWQTEIHDG